MKKIVQFLQKVFSNFLVQLVLMLGCIVFVFWLSGAFDSPDKIWEAIVELITSTDVLSVVFIALVSLIVARVLIRTKKILEESMKIEDDHHKIVLKYSGHKRGKEFDPKPDKTFFLSGGVFMHLNSVPEKRRKPKNPVKDIYAKDYAKREKDIKDYMNGKLYLPSVNVFANIGGDTQVVFQDEITEYHTPSFVTENTLLLMKAHITSKMTNSMTVRLNDVSYENGTLTLMTKRSHYFDMLVTNRCMDYKMDGAVSLRDVYEAGDTVSALKDSELCNQIGINGLIFTRDGKLLVEKRGRKKTTWKDKFAQPISLALKVKDLELGEGEKIGNTPEAADEALKKVILKTIKDNFGLTESTIRGFSLKRNFMGLARDLLEGGKPNLYFYVVADMDSTEFEKFLYGKYQAAAKGKGNRDGDLPVVTKEKMDSAYYLIDGRDVRFDYDYAVKLKAKKMTRIKHKFRPRTNAFGEAFEGFGYRLKRAFGGSIKKECGEAFLACMYFGELCKPRILEELGLDPTKTRSDEN